MNNLKRILSLALASVMVIGMMVVGASAAEFNDGADINNNDAVDTLVALNVIGGYDDGSFRPEGNVTRAQMAKMIAVAMNGGNEDFRGSSAGSQFTDVKDGMWYTKFINYCVSQGVINGRNATTFDPEGMVTGTETAVMVMRAMGYRNETFLNEKGVYSPASVDALAESIGLYNDTTSLNDTSVALNRQNAAQVIYNGIQLETPEYTMTYNSDGVRTWSLKLDSNGQLTGKPVLVTKYKAEIKYGILTNTGLNEKGDAYVYTFGATNGTDTLADDTILTATADFSGLFMQKVRVIYSGTLTNDSENPDVLVLGITPVESSVLATGAVKDLRWDSTKKTLNGYKLVTDETAIAAVDVHPFNDATDANKITISAAVNGVVTLTGTNALDTYQIIDSNNDNRIDCIVVTANSVEQVETVINGTVNTTKATYIVDDEDPEANDAIAYEGIAAGDWVIVTADALGTPVLTKATVEEGTVSAMRAADQNVRIGTSWYKAAEVYNDITVGGNYKLVMLNGHVADCEDLDGETAGTIGLNNVVYVLAVGSVIPAEDFTTAKNVQNVQILTTTGEKQVIKVSKFNSTDEINDSHKMTDSDKDKLYTYKLKDGNYELTALTATEAAADEDGLGYDIIKTTAATTTPTQVATAINVNNGRISAGTGNTSSFRVNDDAVFFVKAGTNVARVTGAELAAWGKDDGYATDTTSGSFVCAKQNASTGLNYAEFGVLYLTEAKIPGAAGDLNNYGWVLSNGIVISEDDKLYAEAELWDGKDIITVRTEIENKGEEVIFKKGTPVSYTTLGNDMVKDVVALNSNSANDNKGTTASVTAFDGTTLVLDNGADLKFSDFTVIYVNTKDGKGVANGTVRLAKKNSDGELIANVFTNGESYLFVDTNNEFKVTVEAEPHTHSDTWTYTEGNGTTHKKTCNVAGCPGETENCTAEAEFASNDTNHWHVCENCGEKVTATEESHQAAADLQWTENADQSKHVKTCECGKVVTEHEAGANTTGEGCSLGGCTAD